MSQTTLTTADGQAQNFPALVQEMRRRLMLSSEQFAYRLQETPTLIHRWQYSNRKPTKKAQAQLKKVLVEMGELGSDLIQTYRL
jgi:DNA-binding transcriptional regulator YiaG